MALKLAGEESSVVSGLDDAGWLREIRAVDSSPALAIVQTGSGLHLKVGTGTPNKSPGAYIAGVLEVDGIAWLDSELKVGGTAMFGRNALEAVGPISSYTDDALRIYGRGDLTTEGLLFHTKNAAGADTLRLQLSNLLDTVEMDILNADLDLNGNLIKGAKMVLQCVKKAVNYNDPSPVTVFSALANTAIVDVLVEIATSFVGTSPTLDIGDGSDADGFLPNAETSPTTAGWKGEEADTKGVYLWDATDKHTLKKVYGAATNVIATIGGSGLTAGVANVYVYYLEMA